MPLGYLHTAAIPVVVARFTTGHLEPPRRCTVLLEYSPGDINGRVIAPFADEVMFIKLERFGEFYTFAVGTGSLGPGGYFVNVLGIKISMRTRFRLTTDLWLKI